MPGLDQLVVDEANQSTISKSGDVILSSASPDCALGGLILKLVTVSFIARLTWLQHANPELGYHTTLDVVLELNASVPVVRVSIALSLLFCQH